MIFETLQWIVFFWQNILCNLLICTSVVVGLLQENIRRLKIDSNKGLSNDDTKHVDTSKFVIKCW